MMNEAGAYNLAEIWPYPINGGATVNTSMRSGVSFGGPNLVHQFADSNLISNTNCNDPARMSHALSQAVVAGIAGARKRREAGAEEMDEMALARRAAVPRVGGGVRARHLQACRHG